MSKSIAKIYNHRFHNLKLMSRFLQLVPFIRCVILNGSMAEGKIKASSDVDLLIVAKRGRIFTCRAAVLFWAYISGLKRSSDRKKSHAGQFCLNYFLTDNFLTIPHNRGEKMDKYCAENYSKSKLVWGDQNIFSKYMSINAKWMKKYLSQTSNLPASPDFGELSRTAGGKSQTYTLKLKNNSIAIQQFNNGEKNLAVSNNKIFQIIRNIIERMMLDGFGNWVERVLKNIQIEKINQDPRVKKYPQLTVINDKELRFHPPK